MLNVLHHNIVALLETSASNLIKLMLIKHKWEPRDSFTVSLVDVCVTDYVTVHFSSLLCQPQHDGYSAHWATLKGTYTFCTLLWSTSSKHTQQFCCSIKKKNMYGFKLTALQWEHQQ